MEFDKYSKKAIELVEGGKNLFITGKAGTGKTTLLKAIRGRLKALRKKVVVLAPTGVAARNAEGMTIHSFLHLPLSLYIPGMRIPGLFSLKPEQELVVKTIDTIIIDEVSMVRCDLLDMVDEVLRHYRKNQKPFGGVQVIMFGDMYQLMPVVTEEDWKQLKEAYDTIYFFSAHVMKKIKCPMLELKKVYRQSDNDFITLLNNVRLGYLSYMEEKQLRGRLNKTFVPNDREGYIRLTTHNWRAKKYNSQKLDSLSTDEYSYKAWIEGYFPKDEYPTPYYINLKRGARVMFIKNDNTDGRYVNGTLGTVTSLDDDAITVKTDDGEIVGVEKQAWDFNVYKINKKTKVIETVNLGTFHQYPLRLAWAVTIHKSQGLTFDKVIIDAGKAFTYGQVYVALSRCRKFHGIVLVSDIKKEIIKSDPKVKEFMDNAERVYFDDEEEEENREEPRHLKYMGPLESTLWMARDGLTIDQIVKQSGEKREIIYGRLAKLIKTGDVDVFNYIDKETYQDVKEAVGIVGTDAHLREIRDNCSDDEIPFGEIGMIVADLKRIEENNLEEEDDDEEEAEEEYDCDEPDDENEEEEDYDEDEVDEADDDEDDEWHFIDNVRFIRASKYFLDSQVRVVMAEKGYYLEVYGRYIKLDAYPEGMNMFSGSIFVKRPRRGEYGRKIIHETEKYYYDIGTIEEFDDKLVFTNNEDEKFEITLED